MAVAMMLLKCCLYYHCRQVPTAQETAEDLLESHLTPRLFSGWWISIGNCEVEVLKNASKARVPEIVCWSGGSPRD